jgi:aspartyl protease family protein
VLFATGLGSGLAPVAPGTVGSLLALPVWWFLFADLPFVAQLAIVVGITLISIWIVDRACRAAGVGDASAFVLDEFVGQWIALVAAPKSLLAVGVGFCCSERSISRSRGRSHGPIGASPAVSAWCSTTCSREFSRRLCCSSQSAESLTVPGPWPTYDFGTYRAWTNDMKGNCAALLVLLSGIACGAFANAPVEAVGLFKDRAMIRVLGKEHYLTVGQTSPEGATLVESDAQHAVVRYKDETYRLSLSDRVGGVFQAPSQASLSIAPDQIGQYRAQGTINGRPADFLVDTGASLVAISERSAKQMGIQYATSPERAPVVTAQGQIDSYLVDLDTLTIGGIQTTHVRAAVIPGDYPLEVLLGMSFLHKVKMEQQAGVMVLKQLY